MKDFHQPLFIAGLMGLCFAVERFCSLRPRTRSLIARIVINLVLSVATFLTAIFLVRPAVHLALHWSANRTFGLLHFIHLPPWGEMIAGVLLLDLTWYYWHLVNHRIPLLWRFHNVHHIDPDMDVTTAFRFHFGEIALSSVFNLIQVSLTGVSGWAFGIYQVLFQAEVVFHHSNMRLPIRLERLLSKIIVTPRMHGIHHSQVQRENNSNFGTVFTWWDRVHRTLGLNIPQSQIVIGIPAYARPEDNTVTSALFLPFRRQRDYWRRPDGTVVERDKIDRPDDPTTLAE